MSLLLVAATLAAAPNSVESYSSTDAAAAALSGDVQTGTLLFSRGDCLAVKVFSEGPYTHVAAVVVEDGVAYVYDSMNGVGVRRQRLPTYLASQDCDVFYVYQPTAAFDLQRAETFYAYLESQLGRKYAIKHHLTGKRSDGLHCAEYVTDALQACKLIHAKRPPRVSPGSLAEGIVEVGVYTAGHTLKVEEPPAPKREPSNLCARLWLDTRRCSRVCWLQMRKWFLCK